MSAEHFGAVNTPVYRASTILYPDMAALKANTPALHLWPPRHAHHPQLRGRDQRAGRRGAHRDRAPRACRPSALAILSVCSAGDHLLMVDSCYEPTRIFCDTHAEALRRRDQLLSARPTTSRRYLKPNTKAVFCESPGSLTFEVQDIPAIAKAAHAHGASVLMDNTWATPIFFQPLEHGVDLSIQAATKYVGGHADVMLGYVSRQ